jgi:hypothetical protein
MNSDVEAGNGGGGVDERGDSELPACSNDTMCVPAGEQGSTPPSSAVQSASIRQLPWLWWDDFDKINLNRELKHKITSSQKDFTK